MTRDQNVETLTAKTSKPDAPPASSKKNRRWVIPLIWALSVFLALCLGAVAGGGIVYGVTRVRNARRVRSMPPSIERFRPGPRFDPWDEMPDDRMLPHARSLGALILEVTEDSPAERAGLNEGDVIVAVEGQELGQSRDLAGLIAEYDPGDRITLDVWASGRRNQESSEVSVTLGEHPEREGIAYLGVTFAPLPGGGLWMDKDRPFGDFEFHFECEGEDCPDMERFFEEDGRPRPFRFLRPGNRSF